MLPQWQPPLALCMTLQASHQGITAPGEGHLATTDAGTGADQGELRQVAVRSQGKHLATHGGERLSGAADEGGLLVEADQRVPGQLRDISRRAVDREVFPTSV